MLRILESQFISDFTDSFFRSQYPFFGYIDYRFSPLIYWVAFHNVEI